MVPGGSTKRTSARVGGGGTCIVPLIPAAPRIDFWFSAERDAAAAKQFFRKALQAPGHPRPRIITVDGNPTAVQISPAASGTVLDGLGLFSTTGHSANEVGFLMLSKIALAERQLQLLERQDGRRPFERIIEPAPEIAINKQLLAEQGHQV